MKKIFNLSIIAIFLFIFTFSLSGCSKNEIEKISKEISTYAIDVTLFDDEKKIVASEKIHYINNTGTKLEHLYLHLYPRAFREGALVKPYTQLTAATCFPNGVSYGDMVISKVCINGNQIDITYAGDDDDILFIDFGFMLDEKKSVDIDIDFELVIPNSTHRFGWFENNINLGNWYPVVAGFENGEFDLSPYFSTGDPFFSDIANYEVNFNYPAKYELVSTGEKNIEKNNEKICAKLEAKAVRDFAICLATDAVIKEKKDSNIKLSYLSYASDEDAGKFLNLASKALGYFSKKFGEYPYKTFSIVKAPFIYGGMEYPNLILVSNSIDDEEEYLKVIVHEIAHQWWYGVVGNNEIKEAWLDESLSEYSTALFFKHNAEYSISYEDIVADAISSYTLYVDVIKTLRGEVNTKMNLSVSGYQNDYEYSYMVYVKGVIMFDSLKDMVGEDNVISGLKKYYQNNKFQIADTEDFLQAFEIACHKNLRTFFDGFLNGTAIISTL